MPTARYKFVRDVGVEGFLSRNRPSTDALSAVSHWSSGATGRSHVVQVDEDDRLIADLTWSEADQTAGPDLDNLCRGVGVVRSHVQQ